MRAIFSARRVMRKWCGVWAIAMFIAAVGVAGFIAKRQWAIDVMSFTDHDFVRDCRVGRRNIGTALRLPKAGLLGRGRYYVVVVRDDCDRLLETIYEGPGGYPDPPRKPNFVSVKGAQVIYDIPEVGYRTLSVGCPADECSVDQQSRLQKEVDP